MNIIRNIKYYCKNLERGCSETLQLGGLIKHEADCAYANPVDLAKMKLEECQFCQVSAFEQQENPRHFCDHINELLCTEHLERVT